MTHLTVMPTPSCALTSPEELESLAREAQSVAEARSIIMGLARDKPYTVAEADRRLRILGSLNLDKVTLGELIGRISEGMQPASSIEIGKSLLLLEKALAKGKDQGDVLGMLMVDEVVIEAPGVLILNSAVRKLWRTLEWWPSIARVLQAIREEEARWRYWLRCASAVLNEHAQALAMLRAERAWLARSDEEREAERKERLRRLNDLQEQLRVTAIQRSLV